MPRKPLKPCCHPGCPELTEGRYCSKHQRQVTREYNRKHRSYQNLYKTARWRRFRKRVLLKHPLGPRLGGGASRKNSQDSRGGIKNDPILRTI